MWLARELADGALDCATIASAPPEWQRTERSARSGRVIGSPLICIKAGLRQPIILCQAEIEHGSRGQPQMCQQFWPFSEPQEWLWLMPIVMPLLAIILVGVPVASFFHHAGRSRWWTVIAFIPLLNLIGLWVFAFSRWPVVDR